MTGNGMFQKRQKQEPRNFSRFLEDMLLSHQQMEDLYSKRHLREVVELLYFGDEKVNLSFSLNLSYCEWH